MPVSWGGAKGEKVPSPRVFPGLCVQHPEHSLAWLTGSHFANWQHGNNTYGALNRTL